MFATLKSICNVRKGQYLCSVHFDKTRTKANNNMSGRYAQNLSKSYQKSIRHEGYIDEAIERFLSIFCLILSAATQNKDVIRSLTTKKEEMPTKLRIINRDVSMLVTPRR